MSVFAVSSHLGMSLIFQSVKDLDETIENLCRLREYVEQEEVNPPHIYATYDGRVPREEVEELTEWLKNIFTEE